MTEYTRMWEKKKEISNKSYNLVKQHNSASPPPHPISLPSSFSFPLSLSFWIGFHDTHMKVIQRLTGFIYYKMFCGVLQTQDMTHTSQIAIMCIITPPDVTSALSLLIWFLQLKVRWKQHYCKDNPKELWIYLLLLFHSFISAGT